MAETDMGLNDTQGMASVVLHHNLITVPHANGIYWLRLYGDGTARVAVITEVPGNPGRSVMNATEAIVAEIERRFGIEPAVLTCYEIMPSGVAGPAGWAAWRVELRPEPLWHAVVMADIEAAAGQRLVPIPQHSDLLRDVVALGGDALDEVEEPVFKAARVAELPPPHNPFKCAFATRFAEMQRELGPQEPTDAELLALGERFLASLTDEDSKTCPFHDADWRSIAEESVRILGASTARSADDLAEAARTSALPSQEKRWLESLVRVPVTVGGQAYEDGQHRGCALRFSGASHALVARGFHATRSESRVWTYIGDG